MNINPEDRAGRRNFEALKFPEPLTQRIQDLLAAKEVLAPFIKAYYQPGEVIAPRKSADTTENQQRHLRLVADEQAIAPIVKGEHEGDMLSKAQRMIAEAHEEAA